MAGDEDLGRRVDWPDRRGFLRQLMALTAAMGVGRQRPSGEAPRSDAADGAGRRSRAMPGALGSNQRLDTLRRLDRIGIQLYTVRSLMPQDPDGTLGALAQIGYSEVELAGLYGLRPSAMREMLDRHHLSAVSGHLSLTDMRRDWARALDDAATLGQRYIVCSWIDPSERSADDYRRIATELNRLAEQSRTHGIQFAYHNHMYEFALVGGETPYDLLLVGCDPHLVQMEVDLMWMTKAGGDPLSYFARFPDRFPMVHAKDMTRSGAMVDVGQGTIDFRSIFAQSARAGIKHYFVEHDEPVDPLVDARTCYEYLRRLTF